MISDEFFLFLLPFVFLYKISQHYLTADLADLRISITAGTWGEKVTRRTTGPSGEWSTSSLGAAWKWTSQERLKVGVSRRKIWSSSSRVTWWDKRILLMEASTVSRDAAARGQWHLAAPSARQTGKRQWSGPAEKPRTHHRADRTTKAL